MKFSPLFALCLILSIALNLNINAQGVTTIALNDQLKRTPQLDSFDGALTRGILDFPVKIHVVRATSNSPVVTAPEMEEHLKQLNKDFIKSNIRFVQIGDINTIYDRDNFDFDAANEEAFCGKNDVKHVINIYIFNSITYKGQTTCGYSYFPTDAVNKNNKTRVLMTFDCLRKGKYLAHELGHFFALYDTAGSGGNDKELVTREAGKRNCEKAGDEICDTPADPGATPDHAKGCAYVNLDRDALGKVYRPDLTNIMSNGSPECRRRFSPQQHARMNYAALHVRDYLKFPTRGLALPDNQLSGSLLLEIAGQPLKTSLDANLFKSNDPYYSGTNYQLFIENDEPAFVYVIGSDLTKANHLLFPVEGQKALLDEANRKLALPNQDQMYQMDDTKGKDYLCVLYSKKPLIIDGIQAQLKEETGTFIQRLYKALGERVVPSNLIKYSSDDRLRFSADMTETADIVPIIVEIDHK